MLVRLFIKYRNYDKISPSWSFKLTESDKISLAEIYMSHVTNMLLQLCL